MDLIPSQSFVVSPLWQINLVGLGGIIVWHLIPAWRSNAHSWSRSHSLRS